MAAHPLRRLASLAVLGGAVMVIGCGDSERTGAGHSMAATSAANPADTTGAAARCSGKPTPAQTEGPYFKAGSPPRASLLQPGMGGTRLVLTGRVLTSGCRTLGGVRLDFWQANASGVYDNSGYRLRGHQSTDARGRFTLTTIVPGEYAGRTEHIHVKVTPPGGRTYTSQIFFPGVAQNQSDSIYSSAMLIKLDASKSPAQGTFTFVVDLP